MRTVVVAALVGAVLGMSALDLALGALWVVALAGVLVLRRRVGLAAPLVLVASAALIVWGTHVGWFSPPAPASYERGWLPNWGARRSSSLPARDPPIDAARDRLRALTQEELRLTGAELEQRAGAVILLARRLDPVRGEAPREVAAVEGAARRLARTLAAPEFRDLETRRAASVAYLTELDRRLATLRDASETADVLRAVDPAAMAHVSLRPVRDDLAGADAAVGAFARVLGGGAPSVTATATARYDESQREVAWEVRYTVTETPGLRLFRIETRAFRSAGPQGRPLSLAYAAGGEAPRPVPAGPWVELEPAPRGVVVIAAWTEPASVGPIRTTLRPIAFERLTIAAPMTSDDVLIAAVLDGRPGIEMPLALRLPPPSLARVTLPRHAFYFGSWPGTVTGVPDGDSWSPAGAGSGRLALDLVPRTMLLRNPAFATIRGYVYRPNPVTGTVVIGLAALTLMLVRRPRLATPERD